MTNLELLIERLEFAHDYREECRLGLVGQNRATYVIIVEDDIKEILHYLNELHEDIAE